MCLLKTMSWEQDTGVDGFQGKPGGKMIGGRDAQIVEDTLEIIVEFFSKSRVDEEKQNHLLNSLKMYEEWYF